MTASAPPPVSDPDVDWRRRAARFVLVVSLTLAVGVVIWSAVTKSLGDVPYQVILTLLGLAAAGILADIEFGAARHFPFASRIALSVLLSSQISYYALVWTDARQFEFAWRVWWILLVASITFAHLLALRTPSSVRRDRVDRVTLWCAGFSSLMLVALAFWKNLPATPPVAYWVGLSFLAVGSIGGSIILYRRRRPRKGDRPIPMARWAKVSWLLGWQATVFLIGFYVGRDPQTSSPLELMTSVLAGVPAEELEQQLVADFQRLRNIAASLEELTGQADALQKELVDRRRVQEREFFRPEEEEKIRGQFVTYLSYRSALLGLSATYWNFDSVREPELRARCFMLGYAAGGMAYEAALALVRAYGNEPAIRRKLNEPERAYGLSAGMYDRISENMTNESNVEMYREMGAYYVHNREQWRADAVWPMAEFEWLDERIGRSLNYVESHTSNPSAQWLAKLVERVKGDVYTPAYAAQSMLSTMIGDLRIVKDVPLISVEKIKEIQGLLKPGDIFLERRNWYLSNAFLPGFWPHGALYIGTAEDLRALGIAEHPEIKRRWAEYVRPAHDGAPHTIVESVSEGVIFSSATESMHADYVAVLRPRLTQEQIAQAIVRAVTHQGKPYDFEFDFFTSDKLVCTELIYRAYDGMLHFDLVRIMGRDTLPALDIGRKFIRERNNPARELDFVLFLDGSAGLASVEAFAGSLDRPGAFGEKP